MDHRLRRSRGDELIERRAQLIGCPGRSASARSAASLDVTRVSRSGRWTSAAPGRVRRTGSPSSASVGPRARARAPARPRVRERTRTGRSRGGPEVARTGRRLEDEHPVRVVVGHEHRREERASEPRSSTDRNRSSTAASRATPTPAGRAGDLQDEAALALRRHHEHVIEPRVVVDPKPSVDHRACVDQLPVDQVRRDIPEIEHDHRPLGPTNPVYDPTLARVLISVKCVAPRGAEHAVAGGCPPVAEVQSGGCKVAAHVGHRERSARRARTLARPSPPAGVLALSARAADAAERPPPGCGRGRVQPRCKVHLNDQGRA